MYLLLAYLRICAAAPRLAKIRICDLFRSAVSAHTAAGACAQFLFLPISSLGRRVFLTGDAGLAPSRLQIGSAVLGSNSLAFELVVEDRF